MPDATEAGWALKLDYLTYRYAGAKEPILKDVSLSIGQGEFVVLAGRSGSGKTMSKSMVAAPSSVSSSTSAASWLRGQGHCPTRTMSPSGSISTPTVNAGSKSHDRAVRAA